MSQFDIIFRGDIVFGHQLADVKLRLQQLFKSDAAKIDSLFTGRPVPLKRNLDEATANKYRDALLKAGAMVEVCPSDKSTANAPAKPTPAAARAEQAPVVQARKPEWTLAPVGADLLPERERPPQPAPVVVDVSGLSLRPADGNLVDAVEVQHELTATVVAPDLGLAAIGEDLISADEKLALPLVEIELEDWEIAEAGSDLLTEDERPLVVPAVVDVGDFGLAPVGSDLGQLKPDVKPVTPDISQIRLAD
ncbi:hypothetical protein [Cellvibrio sp. pealriver]|uniref:hypothetical protein n=1 Tax=Cellvibrio sp. pealriver TaxID=1622269 RepID=UPI00066FECB8|nr:hypothetical protein [Cellvibrio sp. pealriver]